MSARPTITGETTKGRSSNASRRRRPRALLRTSTSAAPTPNIVFSGTAMAATVTDSQKALTAAGVVIQPQAVPRPCSKVRANTTTSGSSSNRPRYRSATVRRDSLARRLTSISRSPPPQQEQHDERDQQKHDRQRGRGLGRVALDVGEDDDARDLHLARQQ